MAEQSGAISTNRDQFVRFPMERGAGHTVTHAYVQLGCALARPLVPREMVGGASAQTILLFRSRRARTALASAECLPRYRIQYASDPI